MKVYLLSFVALSMISTATMAQNPSQTAQPTPPAAAKPAKASAAATKVSTNPTLKPEPGGTVEYEWGIPVEVFPDGHRKPLWKGNASAVKSARVYSADSPEVRIRPAASPKPASTAVQNPIPPDASAGNGEADSSSKADSGQTTQGPDSQKAPTAQQPQPTNAPQNR